MDVVTERQAARLLGLTLAEVLTLIERGYLKASPVGPAQLREYTISRQAVSECLEKYLSTADRRAASLASDRDRQVAVLMRECGNMENQSKEISL